MRLLAEFLFYILIPALVGYFLAIAWENREKR
jgi:hypothetical protein